MSNNLPAPRFTGWPSRGSIVARFETSLTCLFRDEPRHQRFTFAATVVLPTVELTAEVAAARSDALVGWIVHVGSCLCGCVLQFAVEVVVEIVELNVLVVRVLLMVEVE